VKGRGEEMKHLKVTDEPKQPELHMDSCSPGQETNDKKLTALVVRERKTSCDYERSGTGQVQRARLWLSEYWRSRRRSGPTRGTSR
jgi:hypothetical protein